MLRLGVDVVAIFALALSDSTPLRWLWWTVLGLIALTWLSSGAEHKIRMKNLGSEIEADQSNDRSNPMTPSKFWSSISTTLYFLLVTASVALLIYRK